MKVVGAKSALSRGDVGGKSGLQNRRHPLSIKGLSEIEPDWMENEQKRGLSFKPQIVVIRIDFLF